MSRKLVFDIETVGADFDKLDELSQEYFREWADRNAKSGEEFEDALKEKKDSLSFSPLTAEIVAISALMLDDDQERGAVYFQCPGEDIEPFEEGGVEYKTGTEKEILEKFWEIARHCDTFVTFNGRGFDVPFLFVRSAIYGVRPTKNLMANRYLSYQPSNARHIDLFDQLTFYGSMRRKMNLHFWARAFGIKSSKEGELKGKDVKKYFKEKKYREIARYCHEDVRATKELYLVWDKYLNF